MSVAITRLQHNHRGLAFEVVGDGSTTVLPAISPLQLPSAIRPNTTATVTCVSTPNGKFEGERSGTTGLTVQRGGTAQAATVAISQTTGVTVSVSPALGAGVVAEVEVVFQNSNN